jgi:hypothetical protein
VFSASYLCGQIPRIALPLKRPACGYICEIIESDLAIRPCLHAGSFIIAHPEISASELFHSRFRAKMRSGLKLHRINQPPHELMKYCPTCETRFDDEVMRFCTKDGTPLVDEGQPNFTALPSDELDNAAEPVVPDDEDDAGEVTVVRRNIAVPPPPGMDDDDFSDVADRPAERIVVPMTAEPAVDPIRNARSSVYYATPPQNTFKVVVLTVVGTLFVLAIGAGMLWMLQRGRTANSNVNLNANLNANQNANYGIDTNFNFNTNISGGSTVPNTNINSSTNVKTPTPTPSPTPTPTPRPSVSPTQTPEVDITPSVPRPTPTVDMSRPRTTPTPLPTMTRTTPRPTPRVTATP